MKIIYDARRTGKTTKLVKECLKNNGMLIVFNRQWKDILKKNYPELNVISIKDFLKEYSTGVPAKKIYIDEVELILKKILHLDIEMVTLSKTCDECGGDFLLLGEDEITNEMKKRYGENNEYYSCKNSDCVCRLSIIHKGCKKSLPISLWKKQDFFDYFLRLEKLGYTIDGIASALKDYKKMWEERDKEMKEKKEN
ncbi:MAG: hypothetical protein ACFFG0_03525 [Candidatus Thorarchaeota archaeon]